MGYFNWFKYSGTSMYVVMVYDCGGH